MIEESKLKVKTTIQKLGLVLTPILAVLVYLVLPQIDETTKTQFASGLTHAGRATAAVAFLMGGWWLTEAIPIPATSLLPILLFPLLGIASVREATTPYAHKLIFLFLGGFMIAMAMQRWNLHRRIALITVRFVGTKPALMIAGFMLATAVLSMWVSNTAVVVMMLPIALSVVKLVLPEIDRAVESDPKGAASPVGKNFSIALMLGIAYSASIGGMATLIGTPPNALFAAFVSTHLGKSVSFSSWLQVGFPFVVLFLPLVWLFLTRVIFPIALQEIPGGKELIQKELKKLGQISAPEKRVFVVFVFTAFLWLFRPLITSLFSGTTFGKLDDSMIAILGALILFVLPSGDASKERVLNWEWAVKSPWGVLLLFGGGLSLASAMKQAGVAEFIGHIFSGLQTMPLFLLILCVALTVNFLTEFTSNTATTAVFLPILAASAEGLHIHPYYLTVPAVLASSCAFMMPVATPPNAIVFSSGYVTIPQMCKTGFLLNISTSVLISLSCYFFLRLWIT